MPTRTRSLLLGLAVAVASTACGKARTIDDPNAASGQTHCTACHGDPSRAGTELLRSAPPSGLRGGTKPTDLDVGAHQAHLSGKSYSRGVACGQCHPAPDARHPDGVFRLTFETAGGLAPATRYDPASHTCASSYCHDPAGTGRTSPAWNSAGGLACGGCHDLPPGPATGHPSVPADLTGCAGCHPDTMKGDGTLDLAGGHHLNGLVDALGHADYSSPAVHGPRALDYLGGVTGAQDCAGCHGASFDGGFGPSCNACHAAAGWTGWQSNCSFCHGARNTTTQAGYAVASHPDWAAPPDAVAQRLDPAHAAVPERSGAHQAHLGGVTAGGLSFAAPFACATCHAVPSDLSHVGGATSRATVALSGAGQAAFPNSLGTYDPVTGSCATSCHGAAPSPAWSSTGLACGGCHALPPSAASGHPDVPADLTVCSVCHPDTMKGDGTLDLAGGKHVDGVVETSGGHGDLTSPAVHGPRFFDYLAGASTLDCRLCHGASYGGGVGPSCNACHAAAGWTGWQANCSFCHGARNATTQAGYAVASHPDWAAPPDAVAQRLDPAHAALPERTGAHQAHLTGATAGGLSFAPAFACQTCHAMPADLSHVGGSASRATVALSGAGQAALPNSLGTYDPVTGSCATYCHGAAPSPAWSSIGLACGGCHALPPDAASGHPGVAPDLTGCAACHPGTMKVDGTLDVAGGKHLDGLIEAVGHADISSPAAHGPLFFSYLRGEAGVPDCRRCHGQDLGGGGAPSCNTCHAASGWTASWQTNCSFCHGTRDATTQAGYDLASHPEWSAPPDALPQRLDPAHAPIPERTGAHRVHLTGKGSVSGGAYAAPVPCAACHAVPADYAHAGGPGRAPVALTGYGTLPAALGNYALATGTCTTYCHGATLVDDLGATAPPPAWTGGELGCTGCHGNPPVSGMHDKHVSGLGYVCADCHASTVDYLGAIGPAHLDGVRTVQFAVPYSTWDGTFCTSGCHEGPEPRVWRF